MSLANPILSTFQQAWWNARTVIDTYTLSQWLKAVQDVIKYAYKRSLSGVDDKRKKLISGQAYWSTECFGFGGGSFTVKLRSTTPGDWFDADLDRCMSLVSDLLKNAGNVTEAIEFLKKNPGHLVTAFVRLLDLLEQKKCGARFLWRSGSGAHIARAAISQDEAIHVAGHFKVHHLWANQSAPLWTRFFSNWD